MGDYVASTIKWLKDVKDHATRNALTELLGNLSNEIRLNLASNFKIHGTEVTATAAEINAVADLSGRIVGVTDTALALSAATHGDRVVYFSDADGAITLPSATGSGARFKVVLKTAATAMTIAVADDTDDSFLGGVLGVDDDADAALAWKAESGDDTISLDGTATGGKVGDWFQFTDMAAGLWLVEGFITQSGGSEATPFSANVSAPE